MTGPYTREQLEGLDTALLDRWAFGVARDDHLTLNPKQIQILYPDDLINPRHRFEQGGMAWARSTDLTEEIEVSVDQDGRFGLEDGHHRWFSAVQTGRALKAHVENIKANPISRLLLLQEAGALGPMPDGTQTVDPDRFLPPKPEPEAKQRRTRSRRGRRSPT